MQSVFRRLAWCLVLGWLACVPAAVRAQSQQEMNKEAEHDFEAADAELNKAYKDLSAKMQGPDLEELRAAQRLWVQFRDAEAKYEADVDARGGSLYPQLYNGTRTALTKARTTQLHGLLKGGG